MVRDLVRDAQTAEPAIGQVHLHFTAQRPFRADREHVADEEHPDHERRIDRWTAHPRVKRPQLGVDPGQIQDSGDLAHQMIVWHNLIEAE